MQPVLPKISDTEAASTDWWYLLVSSTNNALDKMMRIHVPTRITVDFQESEHTMNEQGKWDCMHVSTRPEEFLADLDLDSDLLMVEVCTACKRYYDERDEEWKR